jgi:hypothetical protein
MSYLTGDGLKMDEVNGKRKSTRQIQRPLEFWRNEKKVFGRDHRSEWGRKGTSEEKGDNETCEGAASRHPPCLLNGGLVVSPPSYAPFPCPLPLFLI